MARLQLDFPEDQFRYTTSITVRSTDVNFANHVGNDAMISLVSEARSRFLFACGVPEAAPGAIGILITDLATVYRAEAHARDALCFEVGVMDLNRYGGDITFRITRPQDGTLVALAKQGFVFYDYGARQVAPMPDAFRARFAPAATSSTPSNHA
jgi:acyl-CoA thioesterase FadM